MSKSPRPLVAGNWKNNGTIAMGETLAREVVAGAGNSPAEIVLCPPYPLLPLIGAVTRASGVRLGAQDCFTEPDGAYTGDVATEILRDVGCSHVIVGHSERRDLHRESDDLVAEKVRAVWRAGLVAIVCIGETQNEKERGRTAMRVMEQLAASIPEGARADNLVVAYEPVWAIGSGKTPTKAEVAMVHSLMRNALRARFGEQSAGMRLLYGGSVKPANAAELLAIDNVDGALVGGASLKAKDFLAIIAAIPRS
jgi:triosephosphate isomerase